MSRVVLRRDLDALRKPQALRRLGMLSYLALPLGLVRGLHALCVASKRGRKRRQDGGFRSPVSLNWNFPAKIGPGNGWQVTFEPVWPVASEGR